MDGDTRRRDEGGGPETLLIAAPWPYHPTCGIGGGVLCFRLLERLAEHFTLHFVAFDQLPNDLAAGRAALERLCASVTIIAAPAPVRGWRDRLGQATQVATARPREVRDAASGAMAAAIARLVAETRPLAVLLQFPQMAQYIPAAAGAPVVMDVQDACMVSRFREWRSTRPAATRAARLAAWIAWSRYELRFYARADALLALSANDLGVLRSFVPGVPCHLSAVAAEPQRRQAAEGSHVSFLGNFDHAPNRDALAWLLREIWPRVRAAAPDARLQVGGPGIPDWARGHEAAGVVLRGFVEDLDAFYDAALMALVPYRFGGGTKIKALEAMARGCPVVATTIGAEGLGVTPGREALLAEDAAGFAAAVVALLHAPERRRGLAEAALRHVERHFSWDAKVAGLVTILRGVGRPAAATERAIGAA